MEWNMPWFQIWQINTKMELCMSVAIPSKGRIPTVLHIPSIILTAKKNGVVYVGNLIDAKGFLYIVRKKLYLWDSAQI